MNTVLRLCAATSLLVATQAHALGLADLSNKDAAAGLKQALIKGSETAVAALGKPNGFLGNARVRIPLPESLHKVEGLMRGLGMGKYADQLVTTMNRAAESAVVEAKPLLVKFARTPSVRRAALSARCSAQSGNKRALAAAAAKKTPRCGAPRHPARTWRSG